MLLTIAIAILSCPRCWGHDKNSKSSHEPENIKKEGVLTSALRWTSARQRVYIWSNDCAAKLLKFLQQSNQSSAKRNFPGSFWLEMWWTASLTATIRLLFCRKLTVWTAKFWLLSWWNNATRPNKCSKRTNAFFWQIKQRQILKSGGRDINNRLFLLMRRLSQVPTKIRHNRQQILCVHL